MLTTQSVRDRNLDRAIGELLANARRLAVGGFAREACEALDLLMQPGPWQLPAHGAVVHQVQRMMAPVAMLAGQPSPAIGDRAAISQAQMSDWAECEARSQVRRLAQAGGTGGHEVGANWSPAFLATLVERRGGPDDPRLHQAFGDFGIEAQFVLKARIGERFGCSTAIVGMPSPEALASLGLPADELAQLLTDLRADEEIAIAPAALATDTLDIARACVTYQQATGIGGGSLDSTIFAACWLLLVDEGRDAAATEVAESWLLQDAHAAATMLDLAPVPSVARYLHARALAPVLQVDADAADRWLATLKSRPQAAPGRRGAAPAVTALLAPQAFRASLAGTALHRLKWLQVPVPGTDEHAWVASIPVAERRPLWHAARALTERTGRWPVVTTLWCRWTDPPDVQQLGADLFMRAPYAVGPARDDITPRAFIVDSVSVDTDDFLAQRAASAHALDDDDQLTVWRDELEADGLATVSFDQAWAECSGDRMRFEQWLAEHEAAHGQPDPDRGRPSPYEPDNAWLVLLPTPRCEEALAYLHWYAMEHASPEGFIALLRRWRERHGAELFAHYGTMLEFVVRRPPQKLDEALSLAREHELAAPCTLILPGIALRHYAVGLLGHDQWFLHERP